MVAVGEHVLAAPLWLILIAGVGQEFRNRIADGRDIRLDHADHARRLPAAHQIGCGFPGTQIEAASNVFTAQRALHRDGTLAVSESSRAVPAGRLVATVKDQHGASSRLEAGRYKPSTAIIDDAVNN